MQVFELPKPTTPPDALAFSPDGRLLVAASRGRLFVIDTADGGVRILWGDADTYSSRGSGLTFTTDGRAVVAHHSLGIRGAIEVHDVETGAVLRDFPMPNSSDLCEPGPGGRLVYVAVHPVPRRAVVEIVRWNPLTGEQFPPFARHANILQRLAVSADEKWLAGSVGDQIRVWNLAGKKHPARATRQLHIEYALVVSLALSPTGEYVAAGSFYKMSGAVHVGVVRTGELWQVCEQPRGGDRDLAFHPARPVLALRGAGGDVAFYDVEARTELRRYEWPLDQVTALGFSPDGLRCAAAGAGKVVIWDVDV
jgi:WD40 repeat protein